MKRSAMLFLALSLAFQVPSASAVTQYNLTPLGAFGAYSTSASTASSYAYAVNDLGHVAGKANASGQTSKAFIWKDNAMTNLGTLASGGGSSYAYGINDADVVVGYSDYSAPYPAPSGPMAFRWVSGTMTGLGWLDGWRCDRSVAYGVNNSGITTGISQVYPNNLCGDSNVHSYAFLFSGNGPMSYLPNLDHGTNISSFPQAINRYGTIAGWNSSAVDAAQNGSFVVTSGGTPIWLGDLGPASGGSTHISYAYGINDTMDVVGESTSPRTSDHEAYIWSSGGGMLPLGDLPGGRYYSIAYGINNSRQVVGTSNPQSGNFANPYEQHAFIWDSDNGMVSLNSLLLAAPGWWLIEARDINNSGQIVGWGINPAGGTEAFLLTPAPVESPIIAVSPTSLAFYGGVGGANPAGKTLEISNAQTGTLNWTVSPGASWLTLIPTSGQTTGQEKALVTVSVNLAGLAAGTYSTSVEISGNAGNSPQSVPVTLTVIGAPRIGFTPAGFSWTINEGSTSSTKQQLGITNTGSGTMSYSTSGSVSWIQAPSSGCVASGAYNYTDVSVNPSGKTAGTYSGNVVIAASGAVNTPQNVPVTMTILPAITITYPNGPNVVLTPLSNVVITWNVNAPGQTVAKTDTYYTSNIMSTWTLIKSQKGMKSSCVWRVPKASGAQFLVKTQFKNAAGTVIAEDTCDFPFGIY